MKRHTKVVLCAGFAALIASCSSEGSNDYLRVGDGGFIFNYRIAEATAGIIAEPKSTLPSGSTIVARFDNPAGDEPLTVLKTVSEGRKRYSFSTPIEGVIANKPYAVTIQLIGTSGDVLQEIRTTIQSDIDQSILPDKPLTIGPGYHRNPDLANDG